MTSEQVKLVRQSFKTLRDGSERTVALFYGCLFDLNPGLEDLFSRDVSKKGEHLISVLSFAVGNLDQSERLTSAVEAMRLRLEDYRFDDFDYRTISQALIWTLGRALGPSFTPEVRSAWTAAYNLFSGLLRGTCIAA